MLDQKFGLNRYHYSATRKKGYLREPTKQISLFDKKRDVWPQEKQSYIKDYPSSFVSIQTLTLHMTLSLIF